MQRGHCGRSGGVLTLVAITGLALSARPAEGAIPTLRDSLKGLAQEIIETSECLKNWWAN